MNREEFREAVFARDGGQCVVPGCDHYARDAHHLIERALWEDGGYHLDNGVSLCHGHHLEAEQNILSPESLRKWAGINKTLVPDQLDSNLEHDKWGKVKYPRTFHLPWSPGRTSDDKVLDNLDHFKGKEIVVTEKLDGENTTLYRDAYHARSLDTDYHSTRTWVQNLQARIGWEIPEGWRLCGENLAGLHAIEYKNLPTYFFLFSIWDSDNYCLSWEDTEEYALILNLYIVPVLWSGRFEDFDHDKLFPTFKPLYSDEIEGYVVRIAGEFIYAEFPKSVAKYVRADHVDPTNTHWRHKTTAFNNLAN